MFEHVRQVVSLLLRIKMLEERQVIHLYSELAKIKIVEVTQMVAEQLKNCMPFLKDEAALVGIFGVLR
jgi:hypothetical protein